MSEWFFDGTEIGAFPIDDRGAQYGDGLFETVAIRQGKPRFWQAHCARLLTGCRRLNIHPPDVAVLHNELLAALDASGLNQDRAIAKIIVTAGIGPRGYARPGKVEERVYIGIFEAPTRCDANYRNGVVTRICDFRLALQPALAGIKSLGRLEQVLARAEWKDSSIAEGLMLDTEDRLICGTMSNVFVVIGQSIATPATTRCGVAGVMRAELVGALAVEGISCEQRDIDASELASSDELFLTNSQFGIWPVRQVDSRVLGVGPVTIAAMKIAAQHGVAECKL